MANQGQLENLQVDFERFLGHLCRIECRKVEIEIKGHCASATRPKRTNARGRTESPPKGRNFFSAIGALSLFKCLKQGLKWLDSLAIFSLLALIYCGPKKTGYKSRLKWMGSDINKRH